MTATMARRRLVHGGPPGLLQTAAALRLTNVDTDTALTRIEGRAVPYSTWTNRNWHLLSIHPGAFDKSIREAAQRLPLLLFHDHDSFPIGTATEWRSETDGLYGVWTLDGSAEAQRAARAAREGLLTGLSIGFQPIRAEWQITDPADYNMYDAATFDRQTIVEGRLAEVSLTSVPSFKDAQVSVVASARHAGQSPNLDRWRAYRASLS